MMHRRKRKVPLTYLICSVSVLCALWVADKKIGRYDTINQETLSTASAIAGNRHSVHVVTKCTDLEAMERIAINLHNPGYAPELVPPPRKPLTVGDLK